MWFSSTPKVSTDAAKIDELLTRSVAEVLPSREELKRRLLSGERLKIYIGADATGPQLHIGHATNFILMEKLRQLGHEVIILFGDFTALIGDPSGHDSARKSLTEEEVNVNIKTWKEQVSKIVNFSDSKNPARLLKNSEWLSKLTFQDVIKLAASFTVQHMLERDLFEVRLKEEKPLYLHEFLYPVMQGYDSVAMNVDVEVGGTDQTFNMLAGRILQKKYSNKEKFVISTTLLENPKDGKKLMSKSLGNFIALNDVPAAMYTKAMQLPDEALRQLFVDCTYLSLTEIDSILSGDIRTAKARFAWELVKMYHDEKYATAAQDDYRKKARGEAPESRVVSIVDFERKLADALVVSKIVSSKSDFRRLVAQGAVSSVTAGEVIDTPDYEPKDGEIIKIGKDRFTEIKKI